MFPNRLIKTILIISIFCSLLYVGHLVIKDYSKKQNENMAQMRREIKEELFAKIQQDLKVQMNQQIEQLVQVEVKKEFNHYLAQLESSASFDKVTKTIQTHDRIQINNENETLTHLSQKENIQKAVRRAVKEVLHEATLAELIADEDLDQIIGGSDIDKNYGMVYGKTSPATHKYTQLAQNTNSNNKRPDDDDDDAITGSGVKDRSKSMEMTLQQKGSVLLPKGNFQMESSTSWSHFSSNRINIQGFSILPVLVIGDISTEKVKRDIFIQTFAFKYGLLHNLQAELKVPYRFEYDRQTPTSTNSNEVTNSDHGVGDIDFGFSRQIGWEDGWKPDLIAAINVKTPTGRSPYNRDIGIGTGHWAIRSSLTAAKSSDPTVIFGSINYTYNFENEFENFGKVKPGDSIGYSLGTAIALSYQTALNFSFDHTIGFKMKRNGNAVNGSFLNSANFKSGINWAFNERFSMDFGVAIGVTEDAPDVSVDIRFPISF